MFRFYSLIIEALDLFEYLHITKVLKFTPLKYLTLNCGKTTGIFLI